MPTLTLILKNRPLGDYDLIDGVSITIGRREDNDVVIDDPAVSGHHAKIDALGNRFVMTDLQSKNGSFVNEQLIHSHWLKDGDVINIGGHCLAFKQKAAKQPGKKRSDQFDDTLEMNSSQHRRMMIKSTPHKSINVVRFWDKGQNRGNVQNAGAPTAVPSAATGKEEPGATLTYLAGGGGRIELMRKLTTIGKHPASDVKVKGLLLDPTTATISKELDGFHFNYIGGLPKPKINDTPVSEKTLLIDSDIIEIGSTKLQFSLNRPKRKTT